MSKPPSPPVANPPVPSFGLLRFLPHRHRWVTTADAWMGSLLGVLGHAWVQPSRCERCGIGRDRLIDCPPGAPCIASHPKPRHPDTMPTHSGPPDARVSAPTAQDMDEILTEWCPGCGALDGQTHLLACPRHPRYRQSDDPAPEETSDA